MNIKSTTILRLFTIQITSKDCHGSHVAFGFWRHSNLKISLGDVMKDYLFKNLKTLIIITIFKNRTELKSIFYSFYKLFISFYSCTVYTVSHLFNTIYLHAILK